MARPTCESGTVTRKPDDAVGSRGEPPTGGGRQTSEQASITDMGSDHAAARPEPRELWGGASGPGQAQPAIGGSSGGHSDQQASRGPGAGRKVAGVRDRAEREAEE